MVEPQDPLHNLANRRMPRATEDELMGAVENSRWLVDWCLRVAGRIEEDERKPPEPPSTA